MKVAFRHVPFSDAQRSQLDRIAADAGYETLWLSDDIPTADELADCEILMGYFPRDILKKLPALRWLQVPSAGVERYCGDIYASPDVILTNCSGAFGIAIAEYMLTGLLMLMRNMPAYASNQRGHIWRCEGVCRSIFGSTVAVIGMGNIGTSFAMRVKALGAVVRGVRRTSGTGPACFDAVYSSDQLGEAVSGADIVAVCLPGTSDTRGMIDAGVISRMSPNAILCNCGRGITVDQAAMTAALAEGRIAGAVLDVFDPEPLDPASPLWDMPNVIITPHISGHDDDPINSDAIFGIFRENLIRYFDGQTLAHIVDRSRGY